MWFGILTPGAHASRPTPTVTDATVYAWNAPERVRVDGPAATVHHGLRTLQRRALEGAGATMPRCFCCREPYDLPDADAVRDEAGLPELDAEPGVVPPSAPVPAGSAARRARFFLVHLQQPAGDAAPEDEEALVVVPGTRLALLVPLAVLPQALEVLEVALDDVPDPVCEACGTTLPGSRGDRDAAGCGRPAPRARRRGGHGTRRRAA